MAWYITNGVLHKNKKSPDSILTNMEVSGNAVLPEGITSIGNQAFRDCDGLTGITIPEGVTSIGDRAFYGCSSLKSITIPRGITSIKNETFRVCSSLRSIRIPEGITSIGNYAFSSCTNLTSIPLPKSLTLIGNGAFSYCTGLTSISLPEGITSIGNHAFYHCTKLTSIRIPENVTSIGEEAFSVCTSLTSITIPARFFTQLDKYLLKQLQTISCPISLKDAPASVRLKLCIGFALRPDGYSDDLRNEYLAHIKKNAAKLVETAFEYPELLHLMCREKLIPAKSIDAFTEEAAKRGDTELTAALLDYQNTIGMAEVSKARERKEKIRERQDETVIERMAERADHVGIEGLNFAATGGLRMFKSRDNLKEYIAERGGKLQSSMSAKTDYLITNDADSGSEKNKKAAELGIVVISEAKFLNMCTRKKHID